MWCDSIDSSKSSDSSDSSKSSDSSDSSESSESSESTESTESTESSESSESSESNESSKSSASVGRLSSYFPCTSVPILTTRPSPTWVRRCYLGVEWAIMDLYIIHIYVLTFISKFIYNKSYPDRSHFEKKA